MIDKIKNVIDDKGFTLIEVIVSLILISILAAMMVTYMTSAVSRSTEPLTITVKHDILSQVMENITAEYMNLADRDDCVEELYDRVGAHNSNHATGYGAYEATREWIDFSSGAETTSPDHNILKLTITPYGDSTVSLTKLFTATK